MRSLDEGSDRRQWVRRRWREDEVDIDDEFEEEDDVNSDNDFISK